MSTEKDANAQLIRFTLTAQELERRIFDAFPSAYLMILGAIQGLAITVLVYSLAGTLKGIDFRHPGVSGFSHDQIALLARHFLSFTAIIVVTYEYTTDVCIFRRYPRPRHVIGPLLLGLFEIFPIFMIYDAGKWWLFSGIFTAVSIPAYIITITMIASNFDAKSPAFYRIWRTLVGSILLVSMASIVCFHAFYLEFGQVRDIRLGVLHYLLYFICGFLILLKNHRLLFSLRSDLAREEGVLCGSTTESVLTGTSAQDGISPDDTRFNQGGGRDMSDDHHQDQTEVELLQHALLHVWQTYMAWFTWFFLAMLGLMIGIVPGGPLQGTHAGEFLMSFQPFRYIVLVCLVLGLVVGVVVSAYSWRGMRAVRSCHCSSAMRSLIFARWPIAVASFSTTSVLVLLIGVWLYISFWQNGPTG